MNELEIHAPIYKFPKHVSSAAYTYIYKFQKCGKAFPGGTVVKNLPANAGDTGSNPGLGRSHMPRST